MRRGLPRLALAGVLLVAVAASWRLGAGPGIWALAALAFLGLREYFSLVDIRLQDRLAILAAYLCIPVVFRLVQVDWYGLFIVSIPVYAFLIVPFLVAVGGRDSQGAVLSVGAIDLGLFLMVYCLGHLAYLLRFSPPLALLGVAGAAASDLIDRAAGGRRTWLGPLLALPVTVGLASLLGGAAGLPWPHRLVLGAGLPLLVTMGRVTFGALEADLGISRERLAPGQGRYLDALKPYLYVAPVAFHYVRYFTELF